MILVDTGYFLALAQPRDALHVRAVAWSAAVTEPLLVTEYVLWETVNGLSAPVDRPKAHRLLQIVSSSAGYEIVRASAELSQAGLQLHAERADKAWSWTDCISFVVMAERGIPRALTHDHHFEQAGFDALLRRDPS
jgi:predicted nucleic acid-binding protein